MDAAQYNKIAGEVRVDFAKIGGCGYLSHCRQSWNTVNQLLGVTVLGLFDDVAGLTLFNQLTVLHHG